MPKKVDSIVVKQAESVAQEPLELTQNDSDSHVVNEKEKRDFSKLLKVLKIGAIVLGILLILFGGVAAAFYVQEKNYKNKAFQGVVVWDEDVSGKNFEEISKLINEKVTKTTIKIKGPDQEYETKILELGVMVEMESMITESLSKGREDSFIKRYFTRARLFVSQWENETIVRVTKKEDLIIEPSYTLDQAIFDAYIEKISSNITIVPKDSQVTVEKGNINIVPAVFGREVNKEALKKNLLDGVKKLDNVEVVVQTKEIRPNIVDKAAEEVKIQTESVISRPVVLTFEGQEFRPNKETVASWITYTKKEGEQSYTMIVDPVKMKNYFSFLGTKIAIAQEPKKVRVENGVKQTVINEGKDGRAVDEKILGQKISQILPTQPSVGLAIPTYVVPFKTIYENVIVADWDKYIHVNIATQTMTAYLKGGEVVGSWKITTGSSGWNTPVGTFLIQRKAGEGGQPGQYGGGVCMPNPPSKTPLCGINYVSYFTPQGHAIHEAWWRYPGSWNDFGNPYYLSNGSHGCVNAQWGVAKFIFEWAPLGTPVIIQ